MEINLPSRPLGKSIKCQSNFYHISWSSKIFKYTIQIIPELPENQLRYFYTIISLIRSDLSKKLTNYFPNNFVLYSPEYISSDLSFETTYEKTKFTINISCANMMTLEESESHNFIAFFIKNIFRRGMKYSQVGRRFFNPKELTSFNDFHLQVWPGFFAGVNSYNNQIFVNLDCNFKVLRDETVLDLIKEMHRNKDDIHSIEHSISNMSVITKYNNRIYRISGIDFQKNPLNEFEIMEGEKKTFEKYYLEKYNIKINDLKQPLLIFLDKRTNKKLFLIPELCNLTGLSENQRNNYNLMQNLATITKLNPQTRANKIKSIIESIYQNKESAKMMETWNLKIEKTGKEVPGILISAGEMLMGKKNEDSRFELSLDSNQDLNRNTQQPMYFQPEISKWGIFCPSKEKQICETFLNTLKQCVETYKYPMKQPKIFYIDGIKFEDWSSELRKLDTTVQALIFLLPGMKKNGKFYTEIKEILLKDIPIPSQVVLLKTIQAQKGLRSICNKILVQICAKIGGVPWTINHMPFNDKPTMIVGYDIFKRGDNNFISFCATTDRYFSKYWSSVKIIPFVQNSCANLSEMTNSAIQEFQSTNKIKPVNVIVYRDGISRSERTQIKNLEVDAIRKGFKNEKINLIFICVNKKTNNKYYLLDNSQNLSNPLPGTVIETTFSDTNDFMLISQKVNQGTVVPSHFHMIENDLKEIDKNSIEKIKVLSYKLCYLYYNWVGSIKIPAPLMYAQKLSSLIGEKFGKIVPHKNYGEKKCLYFI